jgi:hypothetical protein
LPRNNNASTTAATCTASSLDRHLQESRTLTIQRDAARRTLTGTGSALLESADEVEGFVWLCDVDPVFLLRSPDDHAVNVVVELEEDHRGFSFTDYDGPSRRQVTATYTPEL